MVACTELPRPNLAKFSSECAAPYFDRHPQQNEVGEAGSARGRRRPRAPARTSPRGALHRPMRPGPDRCQARPSPAVSARRLRRSGPPTPEERGREASDPVARPVAGDRPRRLVMLSEASPGDSVVDDGVLDHGGRGPGRPKLLAMASPASGREFTTSHGGASWWKSATRGCAGCEVQAGSRCPMRDLSLRIKIRWSRLRATAAVAPGKMALRTVEVAHPPGPETPLDGPIP